MTTTDLIIEMLTENGEVRLADIIAIVGVEEAVEALSDKRITHFDSWDGQMLKLTEECSCVEGASGWTCMRCQQSNASAVVSDASDLRLWRSNLGLTQAQAAEALEVGLRTYKSWELDEVAVPGPARVACRLMARRLLSSGDVGERLMKLLADPAPACKYCDRPEGGPSCYC